MIRFPHTVLLASSLLTISLFAKAQAQFTQPPSDEDWFRLSGQVGGRLISGTPFAKPCFNDPHGAECAAVQTAYVDQLARSNVSSGYLQTQWETCQKTSEQCLLDWIQPNNTEAMSPPYECKLGSVSPHIIDVRGAEDVIAAFKFAKKTGVDVTVKNTGHDYKGRSSSPGSLLLWTHNLKNISYNPAFIPSGCPPDALNAESAVTIGAGIQFTEYFGFASQHNLTVVGGTDRSVGAAGGWLQGGGHGQLSVTMGLGADRVIEYTVVTPDGKVRVANRCQNKDLFWALRGGGGGTFGVVLSATTRASPATKVQMVLVTYPATSTALTRDLWGLMFDNSVAWAKAGWGLLATNGTVVYINPTLSQAEASASMDPLLKWASSKQSEGASAVVKEFPDYPAYFTFFTSAIKAVVAASLSIASRLVPDTNFATPEKRKELLDAMISANSVAGSRLIILGTAPYAYQPPATASLGSEELGGKYGTSVTEAWRNTIFHITVSSTWNYNATLSDKKAAYSRVTSAVEHLRKITKDAAYVNEADIYEPNYEVTFWGKNYPKLAQIKRKYDPEHLLDCWQCVGWQPKSDRFSCYP